MPEVINGGFESPQVTAPPWWAIYSSAQVNWTVEWVGNYTPDGPFLELHHGVNGWVSYEGLQHAELDTDWEGGSGEPASVSISQELGTCTDVTYDLTYAWSPRQGHDDNALEVYVDGGPVGSHRASGAGNSTTVWTVETVSFTAAGSTATIEFKEAGNPDSLGMFLDAVSVTESP